MEEFRFAVMGAGNIAGKFCRAARIAGNCRVSAVASKSLERAQAFAGENGIERAYGDYRAMLEEEKPDCVYIAVTTDAHYKLASLCLDYRVPVLCEKAMFTNSGHAEEIFARSYREGIFVMEAMWSRFLPAIRKAGEWLRQGRIGKASLLEADIGFAAPRDAKNRYFNPALGGGAAFDITVYAWELAMYFFGPDLPERTRAEALWGETGVDVSDHVTLLWKDRAASLNTSFLAPVEERLVIYGDKGKIHIPKPHVAGEAILYSVDGQIAEHFRDTKTQNGFEYEIREVMECIANGAVESPAVPHSLTLGCARLFDSIRETKVQ